MMLEWNDYCKQPANSAKKLGQFGPECVKGYDRLGSADRKTDLLGAKIRELDAAGEDTRAGVPNE